MTLSRFRLLYKLGIGALLLASAAGGCARAPVHKGTYPQTRPLPCRPLRRIPALSKKLSFIVVDVGEQRLYLYRDSELLETYDVSTSKYGTGSQEGSNKTPLGLHRIKEKIGGDAQENTIFVNRIHTGRIADINYTDKTCGDFITSRILWLEGLEPGINKGEGVDSYERYIYIHGTADEGLIGTPASHGCIRMRNADVINLYDRVDIGTEVLIRDVSFQSSARQQVTQEVSL